MKISIAGTGKIAEEVMRMLHDEFAGEIEVTGIFAREKSVEHAIDLCQAYAPTGFVYTDYERMLQEAEADFVYVANANHVYRVVREHQVNLDVTQQVAGQFSTRANRHAHLLVQTNLSNDFSVRIVVVVKRLHYTHTIAVGIDGRRHRQTRSIREGHIHGIVA